MTTSTPSPDALIHHAERVVNGKELFQTSKHELLEAAKNPDLLETLLGGMSEEEKSTVLKAVEIISRKYRLPSVPPPPPDVDSNPKSEPPSDQSPNP